VGIDANGLAHRGTSSLLERRVQIQGKSTFKVSNKNEDKQLLKHSHIFTGYGHTPDFQASRRPAKEPTQIFLETPDLSIVA
jgi:hypothetical protein